MALSRLKLARTLVGIASSAVLAPACAVTAEPPDQAVIVYLKLADKEFGAEGESLALYDVEAAVERAITNVGELEGHEIGGGYFRIFTYGSNADALFEAMRPALNSPVIQPGSYVLVRRGGPDALADRVELKR